MLHKLMRDRANNQRLATRTLANSFQLTPLRPSNSPTATMAPVMICVVDTGRPACHHMYGARNPSLLGCATSQQQLVMRTIDIYADAVSRIEDAP